MEWKATIAGLRSKFSWHKSAKYAIGIALASLAAFLGWVAPIALIVLIILACVVYLAVLLFDAKTTVAGHPRKEMFLCDKHGPMPVGATMNLFDGEVLEHVTPDGRTQRGPVRCCPLCFEQAIKTAKGVHG